MPTDIVMPQMGESIFEGTITKWLKKPGDKVQRDEPLFEISTDKVDAEIPAPASGVLQDIKVAEGATVQVNTVVGTISATAMVLPRQARRPVRSRKKGSRSSRTPAPSLLRAPEPKAAAPASQPQHDRRRPCALFSAGPQNRARAQHRSGAGAGNRIGRTHHQAGHHRISARRACRRRTRRAGSCREAGCRLSDPGALFPATWCP